LNNTDIQTKKVNAFKHSLLAASIASSFVAGASFAQENTNSAPNSDLEVIQVRGIRSSVTESMSIKRESKGVVDAISAEDIGKFPDTNLAESLQRITGVSISRGNGEGNTITVRGFTGSNNMVTMNGRQLPGGNGGSARAFDFSNLASESVKAVEVYKTGRADIATGGIGATVNIVTAKPLDTEGMVVSIGAKAATDTTNRVGSDVTPELSGIFSYTNDDSSWGVGLTASHQQRDSGSTGALINGWLVSVWDDAADPNRLWNNPDVIIENEPEQGQLYTRPQDIRYQFDDNERTTDNAQLTFQYRPMENLTITADYTFAEKEGINDFGQIGNWMQNSSFTKKIKFSDDIVATPIYIEENYDGQVRDSSYAQRHTETTNTLKAAGLNFDFQVNEDLNLRLDYSDAQMYVRGTGPQGTSHIQVGLGSNTTGSKILEYNTGLPLYSVVRNDCVANRYNCDGVFDAADVSSTIGERVYGEQTTDVKQIQLDATYQFDDGQFDFGIESREMESNNYGKTTGNIQLGNWNAGYPGEFGDLVQPFDLAGEFDDYSPLPATDGFRANAVDLFNAAAGFTNEDGSLFYPQTANPMNVNVTNIVNEKSTALYFQTTLEGELGGMPFDVLAGVRYETTDVKSSSIASAYNVVWEDDNDLQIEVDNSVPSPTASAENSYDYLLPSLDISLNVTDDIVTRMSFSKTIARAPLGSLGVSASNFNAGNGSTLTGAVPSANASNPGLLPLESTNFDVSAEWYYEESNYVSVGFFQKNVVNFIGTTQVDQQLLGIRNVTAGPRALAARQQLIDAGITVDDANIYAQMVFNENSTNPDYIASGFGNSYTGDDAQRAFLANVMPDIVSNSTDPLYTFRTTTPSNQKASKLYGIELAAQHFFWDTGFGLAANYTIVRGDVKNDDNGLPGVDQFALSGLSDTANIIAMYEKDEYQVRLTYNWRDEYLAGTNTDGSNSPIYVEAYAQIDISASYQVNDELSLSFAGLNLTGENSRTHKRNATMLNNMFDLGPRYTLGARYTF
jgi:TonB-dependent receptor